MGERERDGWREIEMGERERDGWRERLVRGRDIVFTCVKDLWNIDPVQWQEK